MTSFLYNLKGQATLLNCLFVLLLLAFIFSRYHKRKTAIVLLSFAVLVFFSFSTAWLPRYFTGKLEHQYSPLALPFSNLDTGRVLIHVLGSGYSLDKRLPANEQIGLAALGRLAEGIRIHRSVKNSVIICSGYSSAGLITQAQVTKRAAILLGVEPDRLETLNLPATTQQEASELRRIYGNNAKLILVTDALHMPRAIKFFKAEGFDPLPAPTNFRVKEAPGEEGMNWWPSIDNISLMNLVIHEWLGDLKAAISN